MSKAQDRLHARACRLLGIRPDAIRLVGPSEWRAIVGEGVSRNLGIANMVTARTGKQPPVVYVRRGQAFDTYVHEVLHHLFPSRPHWWVFAAAWKLAGSYSYGYGHALSATTERRIESKPGLRALCHKAAQRRGWDNLIAQ